MGLEWNVFVSDFNTDKIEVYNVFDHHSFMEDLIKIKKKCKDDFNVFANEVKCSLAYYYWSKCEWEVVITSFPPYINEKEFLRLNTERNEHIEKYGRFIRTDVDLETNKKIDVYEQVMMNWDNFITYLWNNRKLIKHKRY